MKHLLKALLCVLLLTFTAKADSLTTWDFSFYTVDAITFLPNGVAAGSGSFQTLPLDESAAAGSLEIVSLDGTMNGAPMDLISSPFNAVDYAYSLSSSYDPFLNHEFLFSVAGVDYTIYTSDLPPLTANILSGAGLPLNSYGGMGQAIELSLVDLPVSTPEAPAIVLLLVGLAGVGILYKRRFSFIG